MQPSLSQIRSLPKADIHSHIDGSVSPRELFQIAKRHQRRLIAPDGSELDSITAFMRHIMGGGYDSLLEDVVERFYPITGLMQTEGTIRDTGISYAKAQKEEGVAYAEGRFAPQYHTREGLSMTQAIRTMAEGLAEGSEKYGVTTALIVAIGRESSPEVGTAVAKAAVGSGRAVALDLGGPEMGNPPQRFREAFDLAASHGLKVTVHAGEGAGSVKKNLANIRTAVTKLHANRLGHAVHLAQDMRLVELVLRSSVAVEMNPVSNLVLHKIRSLRELAIDRLLESGVRVTVNSDDPALWSDGGLSRVLFSTCKEYGFGMKELDSLVLNSFHGAFASERVRQLLSDEYLLHRRRSS